MTKSDAQKGVFPSPLTVAQNYHKDIRSLLTRDGSPPNCTLPCFIRKVTEEEWHSLGLTSEGICYFISEDLERGKEMDVDSEGRNNRLM